MNAVLLALGEDSEVGGYEGSAPMMMVGTSEKKEEDEVFILTLQLVGYIAAALNALGLKPEE